MRLLPTKARRRSVRGRAVCLLTTLFPVMICIGCVLPVGLSPQTSVGRAKGAAPPRVFWLTTPEGLRCTAFSVGEREVVTAAHCIGASRSGTLTATQDGAQIPAHNARVNPAWDISRSVGTDAAVLHVDGAQEVAGSSVAFLSQPLGSGEMLILFTPDSGEKHCPVLGQSGPWIELACRVEDGWSGAPLLLREGPTVVIAGILSGRGTAGQRNLAEASHANAAQVLLAR